MTTATVHHLPGAMPDRPTLLDEQARTLKPGQWVRVTWRNRDASGVVEGTLTEPSHLARTLFIGSDFCLRMRTGHVNIDVTAIETEKRPDLNMDELSDRLASWCDAQLEYEQKPVGRFKTGDNTAEANALLEAEQYVRAYLRGVRI